MAIAEQNHYLTGKLLLAMPSMGDARFHRAVIFICAHDEGGAMGLVINNIIPDVDFRDLVGQFKLESDIKVNLDKLRIPVMRGGPVESARGFILHSSNFMCADTMKIDDRYGITGTVDGLKNIIHNIEPKDLLFALGYAGWGAGQLDEEIQQNSWLIVDPDHALVFEGEPEQKWTRAINKLGIDPAMLSSLAGSA